MNELTKTVESTSCEFCGAKKRRGVLLCRSHWYSVPRALRDAVWLALMEYRKRPSSATLRTLRWAQGEALKAARALAS